MVNQFFGLKSNPFDKDVRTGDMFRSGDVMELESRLKYMQECRGVFLLVGEPGSGKTAALRKFIDDIGQTLFRPFYLPLTTLTVTDFYTAITAILGENPKHKKIDMFRQIQSAIASLYFDQRITPVFVLDEIHMAPSAVLDDLRMMFNFRMDSVNPYILILAGQPAIRSKLAINACLPLRQRIAARYSMKGLSLQETAAYLAAGLKRAGLDRNIFTDRALSGIHAHSKGFPRNINNIATQAMIYCASKTLDTVDEEAVYMASVELSS